MLIISNDDYVFAEDEENIVDVPRTHKCLPPTCWWQKESRLLNKITFSDFIWRHLCVGHTFENI